MLWFLDICLVRATLIVIRSGYNLAHMLGYARHDCMTTFSSIRIHIWGFQNFLKAPPIHHKRKSNIFSILKVGKSPNMDSDKVESYYTIYIYIYISIVFTWDKVGAGKLDLIKMLLAALPSIFPFIGFRLANWAMLAWYSAGEISQGFCEAIWIFAW